MPAQGRENGPHAGNPEEDESVAKPRVTIAEDLVLMLLDPANGRPVVTGTALERAIGGALLLDLSVAGRITADGDDTKALLLLQDPTPTGDPILDDAMERLAGPSLRAKHAVERLARRTRDPCWTGSSSAAPLSGPGCGCSSSSRSRCGSRCRTAPAHGCAAG